MHVSESGLEEVRRSEGLRLHAYPDPASPLARATPRKRWGFEPAAQIMLDLPLGVRNLSGAPWTIGYGSTVLPGGSPIEPGDTCTPAEAEALLRWRMEEFEIAVREAVWNPLNQKMFDALVSFTYNVGPRAMRDSTLARLLNAGDYVGAQAEFDKWIKAGGKDDAGLVNRRNREQQLFNDGIREALAGSPQALAAFERFVQEHTA